MICPRCKSDTVELMVKAPKNDAWEVFLCKTCYLSYRNTESENITNPDLYDERFIIDPKDIPSLGVIPPVPKLRKER